jgi:hypothetical protein
VMRDGVGIEDCVACGWCIDAESISNKHLLT